MKIINKLKSGKVICPCCMTKRHYTVVGVWQLKTGENICFYGVCKQCAESPSVDSMRRSEMFLMNRFPQILKLLPPDEIRRIENPNFAQ